MTAGMEMVTFFNGIKMPIVGLGTWMVTNQEDIEVALDEALAAGYRHFDTAYSYGNEAMIGNVLKRWLDEGKVTREELFITTKLPLHAMHPTRVGRFIRNSLDALQLEYLDLYLIHVPFATMYENDDMESIPLTENGKHEMDMESSLEETWQEMEVQVDAGLTKSIGICNVNSEQIQRIMEIARIQPANVQMEVSAYFQRADIRKTCDMYGITVCGFCSLGSPGNKEAFAKIGGEFPNYGLLEDSVVMEIAEVQNKTPAQILLKFLVQQNIVVIPKSVTPQRIRENIDLFDFQLTDEEMEKLEELDRGDLGRVCFQLGAFTKGWEVHPEWHFPKPSNQ